MFSTINRDDGDLAGRRIVITGGSGTLGLSIATSVLRRGAEVLLWCRSSGAEAVAALEADGFAAEAVEADISDEAAVRGAVESIARTWDRVDGLVNNASAFVGFKPLGELTVEEFDRAFQVNARGTWLVIRELVPLLEASGSARVVNIGTDTVNTGMANCLSHLASKGAVAAMTRGMALELGARNITVNQVVPGLFETPKARAHAPAFVWDMMRERQALSDRNNAPDDVASVVSFLLSDAAGRVTGQALRVNAGSSFG